LGNIISMILIGLLYSIFAFDFVLCKLFLNYSPPFFGIGLRMLFAGIVIMLFCFFRYPAKKLFNKTTWTEILALGFFRAVIVNGLSIWGVQYISATKACFVYNFSPFFAVFFGFLFLKEKISPKSFLGIIVGFLGSIIILWPDSPGESGLATLFFLSTAELSQLLAGMGSAIGWTLMKKIVNRGGNFFAVNGASFIFGGILSLIVSVFVGEWSGVLVGSWKFVIFYVVLIGILDNVVGYNLFSFLLKKYSSTFIVFAGLASPFLVGFFGLIFLGERIYSSFLISAVFVFAGLCLFYYYEVRPKIEESSNVGP
jgi:drug/metabolite transporter (DMT)-like permease